MFQIHIVMTPVAGQFEVPKRSDKNISMNTARSRTGNAGFRVVFARKQLVFLCFRLNFARKLTNVRAETDQKRGTRDQKRATGDLNLQVLVQKNGFV